MPPKLFALLIILLRALGLQHVLFFGADDGASGGGG